MKRLLGILGWLGVALVVASLLLRFFSRPDWVNWSGDWSRYLAWAGLATTLLYALSQWRDIGRSFEGKNARYGSIALGSVFVFLGILVAINWIANRENKRWDLTSGQQFGLSEQTVKILTELNKPVKVRVYYDGRNDSSQAYKDKLDEYTYHSKQMSAEYFDAAKEPLKAQADKIDSVPTILMEYDGRTERATSTDESAMANTLKKVLVGKAKKVYFIQGHSEHDPTDTDRIKGYNGAAEAFKTDNYDIEKFTLAQEGKVPDDATMVVVAGPETDYLAPEIEALRVYLKKGGKLLMLIDPPAKPDSAPLKNLVAFAQEWGVTLGNDIVVDASGMGQLVGANYLTPIATPAEGGHAITRDMKNITAFPIARSATPIEGGANGHTAQRLMQTTARSWSESDIKGIAKEKPTMDAAKGDVPGPVSLAAAVTASAPDAPAPASADLPKPETRVVIVGDSDFLGNGAIGLPGNRDLALNMSGWLSQQENLIAIRPKDPQNRPLTMTVDQESLVVWFVLGIVPLLLLGNGIRIWWRRR